MVPGREITKDPEVTVLADNEATWLFVKLTKSDDFDNFMTYEVDDSVWKLLPEDTANDLVDVYYMFVGEDTDNTAVKYGVLKDDKVTVKEDVTKAALNALTDYPTLNVQAFAIQYENFEVVDGTTGEDVADPSGLDAAVTDEFAVAAWNVIQGQTNP